MCKRLSAAIIFAIAILNLAAAQTGPAIGPLAPVSDFPELPAAIAQNLKVRGCRIPQVTGVSKRHNVIHGQFGKPGLNDWAVLCLQKNTSVIFIFWNGGVKNPARLAPLDETISPSKNGYYRILQVAGEKFMRSHHDDSASEMDPMPKVLDHDGIDDGINEKGSSVHYFNGGKWLTLTGSD